jgi:hypothetical protein
MRDYVKIVDFALLGILKSGAHNEMVIVAARERGREVLVLEVGEGWHKLCEVLGKERPEEKEFPNIDDARKRQAGECSDEAP